MFPAKVVAPADGFTVKGVVYPPLPLSVTIAPAEPLRLPTVCTLPDRSSTPLAAIVRAVVVGSSLSLPAIRSVPAVIVVGPL